MMQSASANMSSIVNCGQNMFRASRANTTLATQNPAYGEDANEANTSEHIAEFNIRSEQQSGGSTYLSNDYMDHKVGASTIDQFSHRIGQVIQMCQSDPARKAAVHDLMKKMTTGWISISAALGGAKAALAEDQVVEAVQRYAPAGNVSYTRFLSGINEHLIEAVRIDPTGRTAEFFNINGQKGFVNLFGDPDLLKLL